MYHTQGLRSTHQDTAHMQEAGVVANARAGGQGCSDGNLWTAGKHCGGAQGNWCSVTEREAVVAQAAEGGRMPTNGAEAGAQSWAVQSCSVF